MEEEIKEREILMITDNEEDVQESKEISPKQPMGWIRTRSMVELENNYKKKEKIFISYEKKIRKGQQVQKGQIVEYDDDSQKIR